MDFIMKLPLSAGADTILVGGGRQPVTLYPLEPRMYLRCAVQIHQSSDATATHGGVVMVQLIVSLCFGLFPLQSIVQH
jgi:hypothetical protein